MNLDIVNTIIAKKITKKTITFRNDNLVRTQVHSKHKPNERYAPRTPVNNMPIKTEKTTRSLKKVEEYSRFLAKINNIVTNASKCPKTLLAKLPLEKLP